MRAIGESLGCKRNHAVSDMATGWRAHYIPPVYQDWHPYPSSNRVQTTYRYVVFS